MTTYLVCEGQHDAELLQRILPKEVTEHVVMVPAGKGSSSWSMSRSLLVRRRSPVLLVEDANMVIPESVEQRRRDIEDLICSVAGHIPVKVILAAPTLEIIFFQDYASSSKLFGDALTQDLFTQAQSSPKEVLEELWRSLHYQTQAEFITQLKKEDINILRQSVIIQAVIQFLQALSKTMNAA